MFCMDVLSGSNQSETPEQKITEWVASNAARLGRSQSVLREIFAANDIDVTALSATVHQFRDMIRLR
jgi:NAD-specific glutamate dehydrogenase